MKKLAFRVWDKEGKKMINNGNQGYCQYLISFDGILNIYADEDGGQYDFGAHQITSSYEQPNRFIIMQWTGFLDMKGKKIFEGDIVRSNMRDDKEGKTTQIDVINDMQLILESDSYLDNLELNFEVLGNIYEQPNLLKEIRKNDTRSI